MKATSLDNSQVHSFLFLVTKSYTLFMNVILCLCCWHFSWHLLTDMAVIFTNINHYFKWGLVNMLTWQSLANMLTYIYIYICMGAFSSQDPRNLWLCLACIVNNFDLPLWSRMFTPNWSLHHSIKKKRKWQIYAKIYPLHNLFHAW